jgi:hypothetical protein
MKYTPNYNTRPEQSQNNSTSTPAVKLSNRELMAYLDSGEFEKAFEKAREEKAASNG